MIKSRINYWNCSKFANLIRGTKKPYALGWNEWEDWHKSAAEKHPVRYWLAETGLKKLQDFVYFPLDVYRSVEIYIRNRWIDQCHVLKTGLKAGSYYDLDTKILHGLFYELVDLVETEFAHLQKYNNSKKYKFVHGRSQEAGLDYLKWAGSLTYGSDYGFKKDSKDYNKPTPQATSAQKILELYNWWKSRENRPNIYDLYNKEKDGKSYYKKIDKLEKQYDKEDTKMLIELIKIRNHLWC